MSAVGKSSVTKDDTYIYVKGSPEMMIDIFQKQSVPSDYNNVLK